MTSIRRAATGGLTAALLGALTLGGCATNPATGERQITLISEAQEIAMGREADEQISAQLGLYADPAAQEYVSRLGQELAAASERPDLPWSFKVIDDPVVNAFALPGGFIYITRGIMTHLSSEAELVGVLGHEIGHVTGRHAVERLSKAQLMNVGLGVGMILSPELAQFGDLAQMGLGLLFLKYSRDDERQADELGVRYATRGGWDAREMPEVFNVLQRVGEVAGAGRIPNWLATHPDPAERRDRIAGMLEGKDAEYADAKVRREAYFDRLDGMVFGPNPREGFFEESVFYHPDLAFRIDFPAGWKTSNQKQSVTAMSPEQDGVVQLTLSPEADPRAAISKFAGQDGVRAGRLRTGRINGLNAAWVEFEVPDDQRPLAGRVLALRYGDNTFQILVMSLRDRWSAYDQAFDRSQRSFARVTDRRILDVQPARVKVVKLRRSMSLEEFERRYPSTVDTETLALINHVDPGGTLAAGTLAKQVVGGPSG